MTRLPAYRSPVSFLLVITALLLATACKGREGGGEEPATSKQRPRVKPADALEAELKAPVSAHVMLRISGTLSQPRGVAVDPAGNLYVADTGNGRVVKFSPSGEELAVFGRKGSGPGEFDQPWDIAVSPQGNVIVLDRETSWIHAFTPEGKLLNRFAGPTMGFYYPGGIAIGPDGTIAVVDTGGNRVVLLTAEGARQGAPLTATLNEKLSQPTDVSIDSSGRLRIYQPAAGDKPPLLLQLASEGNPGSKWIAADASSTLDSPRFVTAPDGRIYMTDPWKKRVLVYAVDGKTYSPLRLEGPQAAPFDRLGGIALSQGVIYLVDTGLNVVYGVRPAS